MDINYIVPTDMTLTKAMDQYTKWLDSTFSHQSGDQVFQNGDHIGDQVRM